MNLFFIFILASCLGFVLCGISSSNSRNTRVSWRDIPFNDYVTKVWYYTRGILSKRRKRELRIQHDAVVVSTKYHGRWMIEKGKEYAEYAYWNYWSYPYLRSDTIAVPISARRSYNWKVLNSIQVDCPLKVKDFMAVTNLKKGYNLFDRNCQHAAIAMWKFAHCMDYWAYKLGFIRNMIRPID